MLSSEVESLLHYANPSDVTSSPEVQSLSGDTNAPDAFSSLEVDSLFTAYDLHNKVPL